MTHKAVPFQTANTAMRIVPNVRVASHGIVNGSPADAVITTPASSGTPSATGGQIRKAGASGTIASWHSASVGAAEDAADTSVPIERSIHNPSNAEALLLPRTR